MQGESLFANTSADDFKLSLRKVILFIRCLMQMKLVPIYFNKIFADCTEKTVNNMKPSKDGVTDGYFNASGDFRLPLIFINKSVKPRCLSGINMSALSVHFYSQ